MKNVKVEEFKLKKFWIKFLVLVFKKDVWTWIGVTSNVVNFTKDYVKDYCNDIILMIKI
jgi:hypothetical protein